MPTYRREFPPPRSQGRRGEWDTLMPSAVTAAAVREGLNFDCATQRGVIFYMLGALAEHGKVGAVCIATRGRRASSSKQTVGLLDRESGSTALR